jgi:hypothetical protein
MPGQASNTVAARFQNLFICEFYLPAVWKGTGSKSAQRGSPNVEATRIGPL